MRVLVTWGSKHGGTAGIAEQIAHTLESHGHEVLAVAARDAPPPRGYDAAIIGGALYANRWHAPARRFVDRHVHQLRAIPTWLFSSGPLDGSAETGQLATPREIRGLMTRIGALDHVTFGGRIDATAKGIAARAMAKQHAGDWRNPEHIRAWADEIARELPTARPGPAEEIHGHTLHRIIEYGATGWAICAAVMGLLLATTSTTAAIIGQAIAAPVVFGLLAHRYHAADGARAPLATALTWTAIAGVLDVLLVTQFLRHAVVLGVVLPIGLVFASSLAVGAISAMLPFPKSAPAGTSAFRAGPS